MGQKRFNIRVYGILRNDRNEVLLTDEFRFGMMFSKFPGGGLEHGEGTINCIKRECKEELGQEVEVTEHFYTTDYYQQSAFNPDDQLISIYYKIKLCGEQKFPCKIKKFDFAELTEGAQCFRWVPVAELRQDELMFPVDKIVSEMLRLE